MVPSAKPGSILNANDVFAVVRSLSTLIQFSLMAANGDNGVAFPVFDVGDEIVKPLPGVVAADDVDDDREFPTVDGLINSIALSRKRVKAFEDDRRNAMSNLVATITVRGCR